LDFSTCGAEEVLTMFWKKLWNFLKLIWGKITNRKTSNKKNTLLDTTVLNLFGLDLKVSREIPADTPYELTVVVPRAELRASKHCNYREIILSSITIAHSPRFPTEAGPKKPSSKPLTA